MRWLLLSGLAVAVGSAQAQSCCSGGVLVSANIGFAASETGIVQWGLGVDYNRLTRLYEGNQRLSDNNRRRTTTAYWLRAAYQWNQHWATEIFLPLISQTRRIETTAGGIDQEGSFGLGDPALLLSWHHNTPRWGWTLGVGLRAPLGSFSQTNSRGLLLVNDMQPGSGAWDGLLRAAWSWVPSRDPTGRYAIQIIYSHRGVNARYLGSQAYQFGHEWQALAGYTRAVFALQQVWPLGLALRWRQAAADRLNRLEAPNTGGQWLFARLQLGWAPHPNHQIQLFAEYPLFRANGQIHQCH